MIRVTQPSSKYFNAHMRLILILCFMNMLSCKESKSTTLYVLLSLNMTRSSIILKAILMRIIIRNYEYNSILLIFLNNYC